MSPEQHLAILGPELLAEIRLRASRAATQTPPPAEVLDGLRPVLAPAMARVRARGERSEQTAA